MTCCVCSTLTIPRNLTIALSDVDNYGLYNLNINTQMTINFKDSSNPGAFRLHPGPMGNSNLFLDWSIAVVGEEVCGCC